MDEPILIKRYANRKLYDQSRSRYVTLEELEELIRQGREIRVVDAVSGEDLTIQPGLALKPSDAQEQSPSSPPSCFPQAAGPHGFCCLATGCTARLSLIWAKVL